VQQTVTFRIQKFLLLAGASACAITWLTDGLHVASASSTVVAAKQMQAFRLPAPPVIQAKSAILVDADNGQVLYEKDPDQRRAPASTTKLMAMLVTMKAVHDHEISWSDEVPVTEDAYKVSTTRDVSNAYLDPKEHFTLQDMMKFIAVLSANDATVAVADKIGGNQATFVQRMNQEAQQLGMKNTHYMNADGLPQANHYSSARDLATLACYMVNNYPEILQFTSIPKIQVRKSNSVWPSTDELLGHYPGVDGLKTGYTADAGYCYVGTAKQSGVRLISVVMADTTNNIHQRFEDTKKLFDYGFHNFTESKPTIRGQVLSQTVSVPNGQDTQVAIAPKDDLIVDLPSGVHGALKLTTQSNVPAPVTKGQNVGTLEYVVGNTVLAKTDVVALQNDKKANWFIRLLRSIGSSIKNLIHRL
jgi:serine-type D-Ala-D-Ala carboxypeptidase (penicillin-binding protein 5/6)